ncbi:FecR domain-containing protein [Sorangium sp. So ce131]|uniref:FecR family protein n=1 Tax=Sorangium sp. So ce131 TaxID=3133282 RepID=UPI003F619605
MKHDDVDRAAEDRAAALEVEAPLRALVEQPVPPLSGAEAHQLQQRITRRIDQLAAQAAEGRARAARRRRLLGAAAALAAALAAVALGAAAVFPARSPAPAAAQVTVLQGQVEIASDGATSSPPSLALVPLASDDELRTGEQATARASLATGATVEVGPRARVRFTPTGSGQGRFDDIVALERGRVSVEVPPLAPGVTLSVRTPETVVTVHGTRFSVERRVGPAGEPEETRVSVVEGRVAVRHGEVERFLGRGETWSSRDEQRRGETGSSRDEQGRDERATGGEAGDAQAPAPEAEPRAAEQGETDRVEAAAGASSAPRDPPGAPARAALSAQNELLQSAMEARRRGQPRQALERLDRLLGRYPGSPLAEIARVERLRALEMLGDKDRAASEARRYLKDYPQGFGRKEAAAASRAGGARP